MDNPNISNSELDNQRKQLEIEKRRFEIEKIKLEIEKQRQNLNKNVETTITPSNSTSNQPLKNGALFVANNLLVFLGIIAIYILVFFMFMQGIQKPSLVVGIILSVALAYVCFFKNQVRSLLTIWWGIVCILNICWWCYLLTKF